MSDERRPDSDESFLARWSRLKRTGEPAAPGKGGGAAPVALARATPASEPVSAAGTAPPAPVEGDKRPRPREDAALIKDLPPVESLTKDSDYTAFLKDGVPEDLKQKALKRLWSADPQFDVVDAFTEYGADYTQMDPIDPLTQTIYRVGIGFLTPQELAEQKGETPAEKGTAEDKDKDKEKEKETSGAAVAEAPSPAPDASVESPTSAGTATASDQSSREESATRAVSFESPATEPPEPAPPRQPRHRRPG